MTGLRHPPELIERVRRLWDDPMLSASEIGRIIGKSRSAVLGIAYRNNFPSRRELVGMNGGARLREMRKLARRRRQEAELAIRAERARQQAEERTRAALATALERRRAANPDRCATPGCRNTRLRQSLSGLCSACNGARLAMRGPDA